MERGDFVEVPIYGQKEEKGMERGTSCEREMPRDISYYREEATRYNQVLFETSVVLNGGVPIKNDWAVADLPRMAERVVKKAEVVESRVRELETSNAALIGAIDVSIIEIRKMQVAGSELEAEAAAMRKALKITGPGYELCKTCHDRLSLDGDGNG